MSFFDGIAKRFGYSKAGVPQRVSPWMQSLANSERFMIPDGSGIEFQEQLYQKLSWIQIAVSMLARSAATGKFSVYRLEEELQVDIPNHDFEKLIRKPNPMDSRFELLESTFSFLALTGNAYWWLNRMGPEGEPVEIWTIPPQFIQPVPDERMYLKGYKFRSAIGQEMALETWEVLHFKRFNPGDVFTGLSPIRAIAAQSAGDIEMTKWNTKLYGENNGRLPGVLAFADPILDSDWTQLKEETKQAAKERSIMMLRNSGKGGVEWIPISITQKDLEYIAVRNFTKEEIYSIFAPGLASLLAVSATEANAKAGASTFDEFARYPIMEAVGEKITNCLLPTYGDDLVGEFDEIRKKNQEMRLRNEEAYARVHTVDEVRRTYYGSQPIGDDRGELFPAEIIKNGKPVDGVTVDPVHVTEPIAQPLLPGKALGSEIIDPSPTSPQRGEALDMELSKWQRKAVKAVKAGKSAEVEFETDVIPDDLQDGIREGLKGCKSVEDVLAVFAAVPQPFPSSPEPLQGTSRGGEIKAKGNDPFAGRGEWEQKLGRKIASEFKAQFEELMKALGDPPKVENLPPEFWEGKSKTLRRMFEQSLEEIAMARAREYFVEAPIGGVDWTQVNEWAVDWAREYSFELVKGIDDVTRAGISKEVERYYREDLTVEDIARNLEKYYSKVRAETIAVTETTRAAVAGDKAIIAEIEKAGIQMKPYGLTAKDDLVCEICGPKDGKELDPNDLPPWHPNCRCGVRWERVVGGGRR